MISIIETRDNLTKIKAKSTDILQVNYTDINKIIDYVNENSDVWDTNNPSDDSVISTPLIEFATDEEVDQAIQSIINSYEGRN